MKKPPSRARPGGKTRVYGTTYRPQCAPLKTRCNRVKRLPRHLLHTCKLLCIETLIQQHSGYGRLIFENNESARVTYQIDEFREYVPDGAGGERPSGPNVRGTVVHAEGHPDWHPVTSLHSGPFTLVLHDGRKLKVVLETEQGSVRGIGGFF